MPPDKMPNQRSPEPHSMDAVATLANKTNSSASSAAAQRDSRRQLVVIAGLIFLSAFGVRLLVWQNKHTEVTLVQTRVAARYKHFAGLLLHNGLASFVDPSSTTINPDLPGHPLAELLAHPPAALLDHPPAYLGHPPAYLLDHPPADLLNHPPAALLVHPPAYLLGHPATDLLGHPPAYLRGYPPTDLLDDPPADLLGHPPGYSILLALIYRLASEKDLPVQLFQMICDSLAAVMIFLIAIQLLPFSVGVIAGCMAAFAPQFSWNSILLLPDTLASLPVLIAIYLITCALQRPRWPSVLAAGALIGVSCWFRANALLMAPFLAMVMPMFVSRGLRLKMGLALIGGACLTIAPLTIRNAVVFGHFIPVSLGAGQTLLEGIADYDETGSLGLSDTDMGLMMQEARAHNRPEYAITLFGSDAIQRDRERLARGLATIRAHPVWFLTVMIRRAGSMWRLERAPLIASKNASGPVTTLAILVVGGIQKLFITAIVLPLVVAGLILLALRRQGSVLAILLAVPVYYFCVQSVLHTEYRYVLIIHYFLFVIAAVAIYWIVSWLRPRLAR